MILSVAARDELLSALQSCSETIFILGYFSSILSLNPFALSAVADAAGHVRIAISPSPFISVPI